MPNTNTDFGSHPSRSQVFRRSRSSLGGYVVGRPYRDAVVAAVDGFGLPRVERNEMFGDHTIAWPLVDGLVVWIDSYGMHSLSSGVRVYGEQPVMVLAHLLGLAWRPMAGGPFRQRVLGVPDLLRVVDVQRHLPPDRLVDALRSVLRGSTEEMRSIARVLETIPSQTGDRDADPRLSQHRGSTRGPSRYGLAPRLGVDEVQGTDLPPEQNVLLIDAGLGVTVRSEANARATLAALGLTPAEIDWRIRVCQGHS